VITLFEEVTKRSVDHGVISTTEVIEKATGGIRIRYPNVMINQCQVRQKRNL